MNRLRKNHGLVRILVVLGTVGVASISVSPRMPYAQMQMAQSRSDICRDCQSNCNKEGHQQSVNCQANVVRDPRFNFNKCISDMHMIQELCVKQCGDMDCEGFTPKSYTSPYQR
jgi:hypothetical protein